LISKSHDLDFYFLGVDEYAGISDFNLLNFYLLDGLFYAIILFINKSTAISTENIFNIFGYVLSISKLFYFKKVFKKNFNEVAAFYLVNFFYLFEINQIRESLALSLFLLLTLINFQNFFVKLFLTFLHKSAFLFFIIGQKLNLKTIKIALIVLPVAYVLLNNFLFKWNNSENELNILTMNTFLYLTYFSSIIFQKTKVIGVRYLSTIVACFFIFFIFRLSLPIIAIRFYELGLFFVFLSIPASKIISKATIIYYFGLFGFSIFNLLLLIKKYS